MQPMKTYGRSEPPVTGPKNDYGRAEPPVTSPRRTLHTSALFAPEVEPDGCRDVTAAGKPTTVVAQRAEAEPTPAPEPTAKTRRPVHIRAREAALRPPYREVSQNGAEAEPSVIATPEPMAATLRRAPSKPRDPAPSRLSYRMHRLWLTPIYRAIFRVGIPAFAVVFGVGLYLSDDERRERLAGRGEDVVRSIQERPEFMVKMMAIEGASPSVDTAIRTVLPLDFPVSSFDVDLEAMRLTVSELDAVAAADLRITPGGILEMQIEEREPAILWRSEAGVTMLDATGHPVAVIGSRLERPDLHVVAGEGAERAVPEALELIQAVQPVASRLRGLVRMGERRWDVVLDKGQRILLPEAGAVAALERVMALAEAEDMLGRDVSVIDMRNAARPTLRLTNEALEQMRRQQVIQAGASNG